MFILYMSVVCYTPILLNYVVITLKYAEFAANFVYLRPIFMIVYEEKQFYRSICNHFDDGCTE